MGDRPSRTHLEEAVGAARLGDPGDDGGAVGDGEVDHGDLRVGDDLAQARPLRLWPDVAVRQRVVLGRGDELLRHARWHAALDSSARLRESSRRVCSGAARARPRGP